MIEASATIKYQRSNPRKLRALARLFKKLPLAEMLKQLKFSPKQVAGPLLAALESAVANAKNLKLNVDKLVLKTLEIGTGPAQKRWQPVSRGSAHAYKKRTSHIRIILEEKNSPSPSLAKRGNNSLS